MRKASNDTFTKRKTIYAISSNNGLDSRYTSDQRQSKSKRQDRLKQIGHIRDQETMKAIVELQSTHLRELDSASTILFFKFIFR